jgi:hypothetical protein
MSPISSTTRAKYPIVSRVQDVALTPSGEIVPYVGFRAKTPQNAAGRMTEPTGLV